MFSCRQWCEAEICMHCSLYEASDPLFCTATDEDNRMVALHTHAHTHTRTHIHTHTYTHSHTHTHMHTEPSFAWKSTSSPSFKPRICILSSPVKLSQLTSTLPRHIRKKLMGLLTKELVFPAWTLHMVPTALHMEVHKARGTGQRMALMLPNSSNGRVNPCLTPSPSSRRMPHECPWEEKSKVGRTQVSSESANACVDQ